MSKYRCEINLVFTEKTKKCSIFFSGDPVKSTYHPSSASDSPHTHTVIDTQIPQTAATDWMLSGNLSPTSARAIPSPMRRDAYVGQRSEGRSAHSHRSRSRESSTKSILSLKRHDSTVARGSRSRSAHSHRSGSLESSTKSIRSLMQSDAYVGQRSESRATHSHRSVSRGSSCSVRSRNSSRRKNYSDSNSPEKLQAPLRSDRGSTSISRNPKKSNASVLNGREHSRNSEQKKAPIKLQNKKYERNSDRAGGSISLPSAASRRETVNCRKSPQNDERIGIRSRSRSKNRYSQESGALTSSIRLQKEKYDRYSKQAPGTVSLPCTTEVQLPSDASSSCQSQSLLKNMMKELRDLTKTVVQHQHQSDRRLTRMEVSINKTLVRLGDITRSNADHLSDDFQHTSQREHSRGSSRDGPNIENRRSHSGQSVWDDYLPHSGQRSQRQDLRVGEHLRDISHGSPRSVLREQRSLEVPIKRLSELAGADLKLQQREFFTFLVTLLINLVRFLNLLMRFFRFFS